MHTDKNNQVFSNKAYDVNNKIEKDKIRVGDKLEGYTVLEVENNKDNGIQAMAVVRVDSNGKVEI